MELLTEHRPVDGPVVYGFLHLVKTPAGRAGALTAALTEYCRWHELLLGAVFTERTTPNETAPDEPGCSAAFTGLLDALALPDTYGVVLPAASHLGPRALAAARRIRLAEAGTRVLLLRPPRRGRESADRGAAGPAIRRRSPT
ncbi:hypothetical protein ACFO3J_26855 [Streptomyces polygonati]|uniref:Resolvase/invertase-type recombinase catalytic domain-containing protein n=1 Tax=Streptomyces polygonati TaxID=1617087 RepID=A0ABV8HVY3_9ACTN